MAKEIEFGENRRIACCLTFSDLSELETGGRSTMTVYPPNASITFDKPESKNSLAVLYLNFPPPT